MKTSFIQRLDYLDAVRAFALLLGIVFHASLSFSPMYIGWAVMDVSTSSFVSMFMLISHSFRMELFFLIAGFFSHMSFHRAGTASFLKSRFTRIAIPFLIGWFILKPLIISGWIMGGASLRGSVDILAGLKGGFETFKTLPTRIFAGSHLWFLYYMILITTIVLALRRIVALNPSFHENLAQVADRAMTWLSSSRFTVTLLALPTAAILWRMSNWGMDTPDKSLVPHCPTLVIYSGFFAFGWILHRNTDLIANFTRISTHLITTALVNAVAIIFLAEFQLQPNHHYYLYAQVAFVLSYALVMWSLVFLTIGIFKRICKRPNRAIRYVADSSYWLYLIHLPIVVWLQIAFAELPLHWSLKLAAISIITIGLSLLLYDLFVRSTLIGKILNGRKRDRAIFHGCQELSPVKAAKSAS